MPVAGTARITQATQLLASQLQAPVAGFAPLIHRGMLMGAVSPQWIGLLDQRVFHLEYAPGRALPTVRLRGGDRRGGPDDLPDGSVDEWLASWATSLRDRDLLPGWRGETVQMYASEAGEALFGVERSLVRPLGLMLRSTQVNVYAELERQPQVWIARRSMRKPVDPGLWDTLVAGGIVDHDTPLETLIREAGEEAGIERRMARRARPIGVIDSLALVVDHGSDVVHRERLNLYDLLVPADFIPRPQDGEIEQSVRLNAGDVLASLRRPNEWSAEAAWATEHLLRRLDASRS